MNVDFDISEIQTTEFGVGQKVGDGVHYSLLPADDTVQAALRQEAESILNNISQETSNTPHFDPAEKYANNEYLVLPLQHEWAASLAELHEADHLSLNSPQLNDLRTAFCYFLRGTDNDGRRLTALNQSVSVQSHVGKTRQNDDGHV